MVKRFSPIYSQGRLIKAPAGKNPQTGRIGLDRFRTSRFSVRNLAKPRTPSGTKNLISFLLGHGDRARRASQPLQRPILTVFNPGGRRAVRIKFGKY